MAKPKGLPKDYAELAGKSDESSRRSAPHVAR